MNVKERIAAALHEYVRKYGVLPQRITVSQEVAKELDAVIEANKVDFLDMGEQGQPKLLQTGAAMWFRGVLVVADLDSEDVLDIR